MCSKQRRRPQFDPERLNTLKYFDSAAVKRYVPIEPRTFYQAIADGKLRAFKIGGNGKLVVKREDLDRFITASPAGAAQLVDEIAELGGGQRRPSGL